MKTLGCLSAREKREVDGRVSVQRDEWYRSEGIARVPDCTTRAPRLISQESDEEREHALNLSGVWDERDCRTGAKASCSEESYGGSGVSRPVLM